MIKQGEYGLVAIEGFCSGIGYYDSDDHNGFTAAVVFMGSPFNHDCLVFEYTDLRPVTETERSQYMRKHRQAIQKNTEILKRLKRGPLSKLRSWWVRLREPPKELTPEERAKKLHDLDLRAKYSC